MEAKLSFQYDREGDILYIGECPLLSWSKRVAELGDVVVARLDPKTNDIESLAILALFDASAAR